MFLYNCADFCADKLIQHTNISLSRKPVFRYGFELTISTLSSILSVLTLSLLINATLETVVFLVTYIGFRLYCGGYHAKTYARCFLITNLIYLTVLTFSRILSNWENLWIILFGIAATNIVILAWAPIKNKNHPLSEERYHKNKRIARTLLMVYDLVSILLFVFQNALIFIFSVSGAAVAVLMIIPKIMKWRESNV